MKTVLRLLGSALVLSAALSGAAATPDVASAIKGLRADRMGVDRHANLWTWDGMHVTRISPRGERVTRDVAGGKSVDADEILGVLVLTPSGREARIYSWDGVLQDQIDLPAEATSVCWIDRHEIAVAPRLLDHLAEIWDVDAHALVRTLADTTPIPKTPGAYPAHAALLRFDAAHEEIVVLDAYRGDLYTYNRTGKLLRHVALENPRLAELAPWFAAQDRTARSQGKPFTPAFWNFPTLTLATDGSLWVAEKLDGAKLNAIHVGRDGTVSRVTLETADCPSLLFEAWQGYFVFYRDSKSPRQPCVGARRQ